MRRLPGRRRRIVQPLLVGIHALGASLTLTSTAAILRGNDEPPTEHACPRTNAAHRRLLSRAAYSITEFAREFDITPRAIRFYEDQGILAPARSGSSGLTPCIRRAIVRGSS